MLKTEIAWSVWLFVCSCVHVYMRAGGSTPTFQGMINILPLLGYQSFQFPLGNGVPG